MTWNLPPLRSYQEEMCGDITAAFLEGSRRVLCVMPTGAGKTRVALEMIRRIGDPASVIVERRTLCKQWASVMERAGMEPGVQQASVSLMPGHGDTTVFMQQTLSSRERNDKAIWPTTPVIVIDEGHCASKSLTDWMRHRCESPYILSFTATPVQAGMYSSYDEMVCGPTVDELTEAGWLVPLKVFVGRPMDTDSMRVTSTGEWHSADQGRELSQIVGDVPREWLRMCRVNGLVGNSGGPADIPKTILFSPTVSAGKKLVEEYNALLQAELGIRGAAAQVSHLDTDDEREEVLDGFTRPDGRYRVIVNVSVVGRGFDAPDAQVVVDCCPFRLASGEFHQRIGRVLRPARGRAASGEYAYLHDHAGNWARFYAETRLRWHEGYTFNDLKADKEDKNGKQVRQKWRCRECRKLVPLTDEACACGGRRGSVSKAEVLQAWDCPRCETTDIGAGEAACPECGWKAADEERGEKAKPWECPKCKAAVDPGEWKCGECGEAKPERHEYVDGRLEAWEAGEPLGVNGNPLAGQPEYCFAHLLEMSLRTELVKRKNVTPKLEARAVKRAMSHYLALMDAWPAQPNRPRAREPEVDQRIAAFFRKRQRDYAAAARSGHYGR